jgi:hypothetical protein
MEKLDILTIILRKILHPKIIFLTAIKRGESLATMFHCSCSQLSRVEGHSPADRQASRPARSPAGPGSEPAHQTGVATCK